MATKQYLSSPINLAAFVSLNRYRIYNNSRNYTKKNILYIMIEYIPKQINP